MAWCQVKSTGTTLPFYLYGSEGTDIHILGSYSRKSTPTYLSVFTRTSV